jgi:hypothetical protein
LAISTHEAPRDRGPQQAALPPRAKPLISVKLTWTTANMSGRRALDVSTWLHSLGMQQYERTFRDNAIDASILPELTVDDLTRPSRNQTG